MIILDANILWGVTLDNSTADLLRALGAADIRVAVPWVVLEELASQRTLEYIAAHDTAAMAIAQLKRHVPWGAAHSIRPAETERHREHWRDVYRHMVGVIEPSAEALRTALFRESNVLPPCKRVGKGDKTGSRDAAIWLTAVEYAREHQDEKVYFVSANTKDFGDGTEYPEPMKTDLAGIEDRFIHFTSLDDVVELFAKPVEFDEGFLPALLGGEEWIDLITDVMSDRMPTYNPPNDVVTLRPNLPYTPLGDGEREAKPAMSWFGSPSLTFDGASDMTAHSIGGQVWYTATVRWFASGLVMLLGGPSRFTHGANILEARVLVTQDQDGAARRSILHSRPPRALTAEEISRAPDSWTHPWMPIEPFSPHLFPRQASPETPAIPQLSEQGEAFAALLAMVLAGWKQRKSK